MFYEELYFYNENRDLVRVANNKGELTDYYYGDDAMLSYTVEYDFTWNGGYSYPKHALSKSDPPLMVAARDSTSEMVQYLLDCGADKNIKSSDSKTAYDYAVKYNSSEIIELLSN